MNLEDLLDDGALKQDEWSLTAPTFGKEGQLTVVGWSGRQGSAKLYVLKCNKCSQDSELFGQGYFRSRKISLVNGQVPCGCSKKTLWAKEQFSILCKRKAKELGYTFLGFEGEWKGVKTKIRMSCDRHGEWSSGTIHNLINQGVGCPGCKAESNTKPDDEMIDSFHKSGAFHPETKFWRSERKNSQGAKAYWFVSCPECGETGESQSSHLQQGKRPCACNIHRQQEAYINFLYDFLDNVVAIKFGIANNSKQRIKKQGRLSVYNIKQHSAYTFPSVEQCKKAERECLQELECGVVLKRDFSDGYTETTWVYNLEKIIEIYERNGGIRV